MPRQIYLRQIEAFQSVVELGTVVRAAERLNITQSAMSKLIANLEADTGLQLFDRSTGRLIPTEDAMRLYDEVERIYAGVKQVGRAVDAIRREEQGRLAIGCMAAFSGSFIQRATMRFLAERPKVFCTVHSFNSQWVTDWVVTKKLDVGLVNNTIDNPYVVRERLLEHPLVCIMRPDHPLAANDTICPKDLDGVPFIAFSEPDVGRIVRNTLDEHGVQPEIVLVSNVAPTLCEFVAGGLGVSLVHPLALSGLEHRLVARRFTPPIPFHYQLCYSADSRNSELVHAFVEVVRATAEQILEGIDSKPVS